jgi:hypothetical protein
MRSVFLTCAVVASQIAFCLIVAFGAPCAERCADDGADGRCPPACVTCPCSPRPASLARTLLVAPPSVAASFVPIDAARLPIQPDPDDIVHVPKTLLV